MDACQQPPNRRLVRSLWSSCEATPLARVTCGRRRGFEAIAQRHDDAINLCRHDMLGNPFDGRADYRGPCGISEKAQRRIEAFRKKTSIVGFD
jgi:hypothetical protein